MKRFADLAAQRGDADYVWDVSRSNRLAHHLHDISDELKGRQGNRWRALIPLLDDPNLYVQFYTATTLSAVAPELARQHVEKLAALDISQYPIAGRAGTYLTLLDLHEKEKASASAPLTRSTS